MTQRIILLLTTSLLLLSFGGCKKEEITLPTFNLALRFDGLNGHVSIENSETLNPTEAISISMWVRLESPINCDTTDNWVSILNKGWPTESNTGYNIQVEVDRGLTWSIGTKGGYIVYGGGKRLPMSQWTFLTFIYDSSISQATIYWNGELSTPEMYGDYGQGKINSNDLPLLINYPAYSNCVEEKGNFPGSIDDVSIWNIALTPQQIRNIKNNGIIGTEMGLVSNWSFNEGSSLIVEDKVGNNDGELLGGITWIDRLLN